jgi:hypothetical protein
MTDTLPATRDPLASIETDIELAAEVLPAQPDQLLLALGRIEEIVRECKRLKEMWEPVMQRWLEANGGKLVVGDWRYTAGRDKSEKPNDMEETVTAIYEACGGDYKAFVGTLSANAIKPGAAKKLLGERFDDLFTVTYSDRVKVQCVNTKFLK